MNRPAETLLDRAPRWMQRMAPNPRPQVRSRRDPALLQGDIDRIASAIPESAAPAETFRDKFESFSDAADRLAKDLKASKDQLRQEMAKTAVLEQHNHELQAHVDEITAYWEGEVTMRDERIRTLQRLYYSVMGGIDGFVDGAIALRAKARNEAFSPDETIAPLRTAEQVADLQVAPRQPISEADQRELEQLLGRAHRTEPSHRTPLPELVDTLGGNIERLPPSETGIRPRGDLSAHRRQPVDYSDEPRGDRLGGQMRTTEPFTG